MDDSFESDYRLERERMVRDQIEARGVRDPRVLAALRRTPRHLFIGAAARGRAYDDEPVAIPGGQTISQPYTVAFMTEALELTGREKVLEVGTGSGYQAALLAELAAQVYTVERLPELARGAKEILLHLGYTNIFFGVGDGSRGWPAEAPFDGIIVTAGAPRIPEPLVEQLAEGGRLVIPVGQRGMQTMIRATKTGGRVVEENLGAFRFVDLVGAYGWTN